MDDPVALMQVVIFCGLDHRRNRGPSPCLEMLDRIGMVAISGYWLPIFDVVPAKTSVGGPTHRKCLLWPPIRPPSGPL